MNHFCYTRASKQKYHQRILDEQLCSTNWCVYWKSSIRLHQNHPETSREVKRKTERIILRHNKLYRNQNKNPPKCSEECNQNAASLEFSIQKKLDLFFNNTKFLTKTAWNIFKYLLFYENSVNYLKVRALRSLCLLALLCSLLQDIKLFIFSLGCNQIHSVTSKCNFSKRNYYPNTQTSLKQSVNAGLARNSRNQIGMRMLLQLL